MHTQSTAATSGLRQTTIPPGIGYLRLAQIVGKPGSNKKPSIPALIPVSKSTWWVWVKAGKAPQPIKLSSRVTVWEKAKVLTFAELMANGGAQ